jgi:acetylornithine deacetylase
MAMHMTAREMLAKLVSFDTESHRSNLPLIDWVESYLAGHGVASTRVYDETGAKASLYAHIGPQVAGGTILSGHTDVVPVAGQDWSSNPYEMEERDNKLYGRGTADMKGYLALALAAVPAMLNATLTRPIQLALSYDEEVGCLGAPPLIAEMRKALPPAAAAIIGEPTMMKVVTGHKSGGGLRTTVTGYEVHSSLMHTGVSAVMAAAELVTWFARQTEANREKAKDVTGNDALFTPPWTTLHCGTIEGGTAHNITARKCVFMTDIRALPSESLDDWFALYRAEAAALEARLQAVRPEARIDIFERNKVTACRPEPNGAAEALARSLTGDNSTNVVSYGTEAGQFQDGGYSAVICGPGNIEQAHQADEFLSLDQLAQGEAFITRLIERHCR